MTQGLREGDWERQEDELLVCAIEAVLIVDWHVAHHLLVSSYVVANRSSDSVEAIGDSIVDT